VRVAFSDFDFDVLRLWEPPANDEAVEPRWGTLRPLKRKACRKRVKSELKPVRGSTAPRDVLRRSWINAKCRSCGRCPKHIASLAPPEAMAP
jgi:hypothetical protein